MTLPDRELGPLGREEHGIRPVLVVLGHRRVAVDRPLLDELAGDLAHAVGPEVESDHRVAGTDRRLLADRRGSDELVGLVALVRGPHGRLAGVGVVLGAPFEQEPHRLVGAVPAAVAVHREVAADDRADAAGADLAHPRLQVGQRAGARGGRRVAPVGERVDDEVVDAPLSRQLHERLEVALGRVHAAARDEPDQVHARGVPHRGLERLVLRQRPVLDRGVDAREVLRDDRAGAEVEVADLGVAHLALREPHRLALGGQLGVRVLVPQPVEDRRRRERDRVARAVRGEPPAVEDHERDLGDAMFAKRTRNGWRQPISRLAWPAHPRAASTISANDAGSRLAPPTSAPSTSGSASSSAALSGFSEPP